MRRVAVSMCLVLACGCGAIVETIAGGILDGFFPALNDVTYYSPPPAVSTASRMAFLGSTDGVICLILDNRTADHVLGMGERINGIAVGESGRIFITTEDSASSLDASWSGLDAFKAGEGVMSVDGIAADAGTVVVAARTDEGAVVLVYDEMSGALVGESLPVAGATITGLAVANGTAYAVEAPSGEIVSYDVTVPSPPRAPLAAGGATSGTPVALVVGHTGNLFVASAGTETVEEIDIVTGAPVGILLSAGMPPVGLAFDPGRERYLLLTAADEVLEIDRDGAIVETHESDLVLGATAITFLGR